MPPRSRARSLSGPDVVINAAAYTAVDKAESERDPAFAINATEPETSRARAPTRGVRLLHVSTDYVFDGTATRPYREDDPIAPLGVYGESKAAGEAARAATRADHRSHVVAVRGQGPELRAHDAAAREGAGRAAGRRRSARLPDAGPTTSPMALRARSDPALEPVYHYCNDEPTTWHAFATAIVDEARRHRAPSHANGSMPITTAEYPTPASGPPTRSSTPARIRALGIVPPSWRRGLAEVVAQELS